MEGKDLVIYNKSLFNKISYCELKSELILRKINFSPSDSYAILTFKIRRDILQNLNIQHAVVQSLDKEIKIYEDTKHKFGASYICSLPGCSFKCLRHRSYMFHLLNVHHNTKSRMVCQFQHECSRDFPTVEMLKRHIKSDHQRRTSSVVINQNQLVEKVTVLKCRMISCGNQTSSTILWLKKHLYSHTDKKEEVQCVFCHFITDTTGTLKSHFSRKHKIQSVSMLNSNIVKYSDVREICSQDEEQINIDDMADDGENDEGLHDISESDAESDIEENDDNSHVFVKALAITFNTWGNISGIPYSTVNCIVKEVFNSYTRGVEFTRRKLEGRLRNAEFALEEDKIKQILEVIGEHDPFILAKKELELESSRKRFMHTNFPNAKPETVYLQNEKGVKADTYQYVPIRDSLKLLLDDSTFIQQKREDPYIPEEDVIKDTRDGVNFKENQFFKENPEAVPLVVFQDELEVCNPLGSGKTRHKINCTYYKNEALIFMEFS